jgi:flagellar P-ring protein precursor FlgI
MLVFVSALAWAEPEVRIKDLAEIRGARPNQLFGYGLVVGLNGTGDKTQTVFTSQSLNNMLDKLGITPSKVSKFGLSTSGSEVKVKNVAAVLVTAELDPFIRKGARIDVTVSSIGDCKSLEGGTLVMTPLQGADNRVYAVAQGPVSIGGLAENVTTPTHPTVAHVSEGAFVEREVAARFLVNERVRLNLRTPDFTTSGRIAARINRDFPGVARAVDGGAVEVGVPQAYLRNPIGFISRLEQMRVRGDVPAKIVINERTGTLVTGENVRISTVAVSHGSLTVTILPKDDAPEDSGAEDNVPLESKVMLMDDSVSIGEVAKNLRLMGATPTDMIAIFQAMLRAGALKAQLEIM